MIRFHPPVLSLCFLMLFTLRLCSASETRPSSSNPRFMVKHLPGQGFEIGDKSQPASKIVHVDFPIGDWELIPKGHLLAYSVTDHEPSTCLLDLVTLVDLCSLGLSREPGEPRWSPGGDWLVWKSSDLSVLEISNAADLALVKGMELGTGELLIQGHPLGLIWQQKWLSETLLLVGTGAGEQICFGVLNLTNREFRLVTCVDTTESTVEEFGEANRDPVGWLEKKKLLTDGAKWETADPGTFPWKPTGRQK